MPRYERVSLSRQELYNLVWSKPMQQLAKQFGLSDVGLAKQCRKLEIPRPGVGHWQKVSAGKKVTRVNLPNPDANNCIEVVITHYADGEAEVLPPPPEVPAYVEFEGRPENRIVVAPELDRPHPMVAHTKKHWNDRLLDNYDWEYAQAHPRLDISVSRSCEDRALRIMDALLKALNARGIPVENGKAHWRNTTYALIDGEKVSFNIFESPHRVQHVDKRTGETRTAMEPSGRLVLRIRDHQSGDAYQLRDQKRKTIEERVNEFVIELHRTAEEQKNWNVRQRQMEAEAEERRRQEEVRRRQLEVEAEKVRGLDTHMANWRKANDVRAFVEAVHEAHATTRGIDADSELGTWLSWALSYADKIDPLTPKSKGGEVA